MDAHSPTQMTTRALTRAGLVDGSGKPLVTLHGLRHTCGSILLAHNVPLIVVSRHLGHANPNVTAKVYAHLLSDTELDRVAIVFEGRNSVRAAPLTAGGKRSRNASARAGAAGRIGS